MERSRSPWTEPELLDAIRRHVDTAEPTLKVTDYARRRQPGDPHPQVIIGAFGSWHSALVRIGLQGAARPLRTWTEAEALEAIAAWLQSTDDHSYTAYSDARRESRGDLPSMSLIVRLWLTWGAAKKAARAAR